MISEEQERLFKEKNRRRLALMAKGCEGGGQLSPEEESELERLEGDVDQILEAMAEVDPMRMDQLRRKYAEITGGAPVSSAE